jgi:hypothetical protein
MSNLVQHLTPALLLAALASQDTPFTGANAVGRTLKTSGSWSPVADMSAARQGHKAVVLHTGAVVVIGGFDNAISSLASAELFDRRPCSATARCSWPVASEPARA